MAVTDLASVSNQIQKFWSPMFMKELREQHLLANLVNKDYVGEIKSQGDTVYVSQINAPTGQTLTAGTDADSFDTEEISMSRVTVQANKRFVAAFEVQELAELQSQLDAQDSEIRSALVYAVSKQINNYLYSLVAPSASAPDHQLNGVTDFNAAQLSIVRKAAATAKWDQSKGWYLLADPSYYSDMLDDTTLASADYGAVDAPMIGGQMARQRFGFNIFEDNSDGLLNVGIGTAGNADKALAFHPDFLIWVMQKNVQFKVSDLHSQKKFGYVISADLVGGGALGLSGDDKHIFIYNT